MAEWRYVDRWLTGHMLTTTSTWRLLPVIPACGNHDRGIVFKELFSWPGLDTNYYHYTTPVAGRLSIITLNTEISVAGDQRDWLQGALAGTHPAETRVMLSDTVTEGRSAEFRFRAAAGNVPDGQTTGDTGLAPGAITGLQTAAKRHVVIIEPQSPSNPEGGLRLGAFVSLFDSLQFPDLSTDPPGVFTLVGQPFVCSAMSNGAMTIHRVLVTVYPRPDVLRGDE